MQPACKWFVSDVKMRARRGRAAQNFRFGMASRSHLGTQVADHIGGYVRASSSSGGSGALWVQRIAGGATAPPLPAAVPVGSGLGSEGPVDLFWRG